MIYVTGDTHGEFERLGSKHFPGGPGDYLIVCGDFGGVWDNSHQEQYWRKWLSQKPFTTFLSTAITRTMTGCPPILSPNGAAARYTGLRIISFI